MRTDFAVQIGLHSYLRAHQRRRQVRQDGRAVIFDRKDHHKQVSNFLKFTLVKIKGLENYLYYLRFAHVKIKELKSTSYYLKFAPVKIKDFKSTYTI